MSTVNFGNLTQDKKILIFSDLHIGDPRCDPHQLGLICATIRLERPDVLVLAGDVLEEDLACHSEKARLSEACLGIPQIIVLKGNHDTDATRRFAYSIKALFDESITGLNGGKSYAIEHGNRFDSWWVKVPGLGKLSIWLNRIIYRVFRFDLQKWLRQFSVIEKKLVAQHKKAAAAWPNVDTVVTGHTHIPEGTPLAEGYFNSGDWLYHKTYVVINNGLTRLEYLQ